MPEFVSAQSDPKLRAWVGSIELGIELGEDPFDEIIPGLPVRDPFSDDGIAAAETALLHTFRDERALEDNGNLMMRFVKYLGQAYFEKLECRWVWQPNIRPWGLSSPAIEYPWPNDMLFPLVPVMNATVIRRTGRQWLWVFGNNRKRYEEWVEQGRPGFAEWKAHDLETPLPDGNIAGFDDRWKLIQTDTLPAYQHLIGTDLAQARDIVGSDIDTRIDNQRLASQAEIVGRLSDVAAMTPTAVQTRLAFAAATVMVLTLAGCGHSSAPQETNSATTAVTGIDPNRGVYNRLKEIEERRPDQIPKTARTDYSWAFDPDTGRLLPYRDAYARAH